MNERLDVLMRDVEGLGKQLAALTEANGQKEGKPNADAIHKDEIDKRIKAAIEQYESVMKAQFEKMQAESKMIRFPEGAEKSAKGLSDFLVKVRRNDPELMKTNLTEGTPAQGGYSVPSGTHNIIWGELNDPATIVPKCTAFPHGMVDGYTKNIPKWLTDLTVGWVDEEGLKTQTKPTLTRKQSILKKLACIIVESDELRADNIIGLDQKLAELVGQNMAYELERVILTGDVTGLGDPFNGIYYSTPATVTQTGGNLSYTDMVNIWNNANVLENYRAGSEWYMNRKTLGIVLGMVDLSGRPIHNFMAINDKPALAIFGDKVNISNTLLNTLGAGNVCSTIIYGNYKNVALGFKDGDTGINVDFTQHAVVSSAQGAITTNLWQQDMSGFRFVMRRGVVVVNPLAFSVGLNIK